MDYGEISFILKTDSYETAAAVQLSEKRICRIEYIEEAGIHPGST